MLPKIYACMGSHGSGKEYLGKHLNKKFSTPFVPSPVSAYWEAIKLKNLDKKEDWENEYHQSAVLGAIGYKLFTYQKEWVVSESLNLISLFERTPLDVLAYSKLLSCSQAHQKWETKIAFGLTEAYVDTIIFVPYEPAVVAQGRQEHTDYREKQSRAVATDEYMKWVLMNYFSTPRKTRLVCVTGDIKSRISQVEEAIIGQNQYYLNNIFEFDMATNKPF
jgi:nicotinamide riboside kinase